MTRKPPRTASAEERALFEESVRQARVFSAPLSSTRPAKPGSKKAAGSAGPSGIDGTTANRLHRGLLEPEAKLDLHGFTEDAAHPALARFLRAAQARGLRLVLVVTGKGVDKGARDMSLDQHAARLTRGVLNRAVPRWLAEPGFSGLIADLRSAHRRHGGAGAFYVYLRKRPR